MDILGWVVNVVKNPIFIISLIFWLTAIILVKLLGKKRDNITLFIPFLALFRVKLFNRFFAKVAKKHRKIWKIWWNIGIITSFGLMLFALWFFGSNLFQLIVNPKPENAILPLIPGVTISLPMFSAFLLPILVTISAHEFSHAIAAEIDEVHVKSAGIVVGGVGVILGFGAFVEVDDFHINSKVVSSLTRLRTFSAGVWTNVILAGIVFLLLSFYPQVMQIGYDSNSFQVSNVISANEGGFNEGTIETGDIVYMINGTIVDLYDGTSLERILANQTADINCSVGNTLEFTCYNPETRDYYTRNVILGFRSFVGFTMEQVNMTAFRVVYVYTTLEGGNNEGLIRENTTIVAFDNIAVNYNQNQTFQQYLTEREPGYTVNLTSDQGEIFQINVNYQPRAAGAYLLQYGYLGINIEQISNGSFIISNVLSNTTEYGINEGNVPEGVTIHSINGVSISLENETFKDFMENNFSPRPGDVLIFTDSENTNYSLIVSDIPIIPVYIGITSESYWIPANWFGRLLGGHSPDDIFQFLSNTFMISFSLALFNLLPIGIFDGGRLMKEIIHMIVGKSMKKGTKKKVRYIFDAEAPTQHLMTHNIEEILSVEILAEKYDEDPQNEKIPSIPIKFQSHDASGTGIIDSVIPLEPKSIPHESLIEVTLNCEEDQMASKKNIIYKSISWGVGAMLIASFVISIVKFGDTFFWLG